MRTVMKWDYKDKDGNVVGHVLRLENENELAGSKTRKQIIPYFKGNNQAGIPEDLPREHRIYGRETVTDLSKPIFIVEGEKCAHALHGLGYQAITNVGSSGQGHKADWSIVCDAKHIIIMPDNDETGWKYAQGIYTKVILHNKEAKIELLAVKSSEKADVCNLLKDMPNMGDWDELSSLKGHPLTESLKGAFNGYMQSHIEDIPASWKFITTKNKHKLIAANDFKRLKLPKRHMLLYPWMPEGSINMVFADRGIGKTFFSLSCALALANGEEFLCYKAEHPVPVLYLDGEMQGTSIQERLHKLSKGNETKAPLTLYTPDCQDLDYIPDLGTENGRDEINELIEATSPKVIFIDNISTFDRTGNENEAESWSPIQAWAIQHRKAGRSLIFIHHANKEGKQRGSHKKEDVMDAVIRLKRPDDHIQGEGDTKMMVQYTKARHLSGDQAQDIEATLCSDDEYLKWEWEQGDILYHKAVQMLKDGVSMRDIAEEMNLGKSTIHRWKTKAQGDDLL